MDLKKVRSIQRDIPDYEGFLTVDELAASTRRLADRYPGIVQVSEVGRSRQGQPIEVIKVGNGQHRALVFALPHPNEPIGSMTLEYLSTRLAQDDTLRESLGYTWFLIKCIDPDGTRLNEGWFKGPFSIERYARNFYRPPSRLQVEWTFPIDYKTLHFHDTMPETKVLMDLIEEQKPDFMYSLHNLTAGAGAVWYAISEAAPPLYAPFRLLAEEQGLPLSAGEPEPNALPGATPYAPGVYGHFTVPAMYEHRLAHTGEDPAETLITGAGSIEYAQRFCDPFWLACELPYTYDPVLNDTSPSGVLLRDAILESIEMRRRDYELLSEIYDSVSSELTAPSPFLEAFAGAASGTSSMDARENWARTNPRAQQMATVAEKHDNLVVQPLYILLTLGMALRAIDCQMEAEGPTPSLVTARDEAEELFGRRSQKLDKLQSIVIPIRKLVAVQLGAGLLAAEYARGRH